MKVFSKHYSNPLEHKLLNCFLWLSIDFSAPGLKTGVSGIHSGYQKIIKLNPLQSYDPQMPRKNVIKTFLSSFTVAEIGTTVPCKQVELHQYRTCRREKSKTPNPRHKYKTMWAASPSFSSLEELHFAVIVFALISIVLRFLKKTLGFKMIFLTLKEWGLVNSACQQDCSCLS